MYYNYPNYSSNTSKPFVDPNVILKEINNYGRLGHCFKSNWAGKEHEFRLIGFDTVSGMVYILENNSPGSVHHSDMDGFNYVGIQCANDPCPNPSSPTPTPIPPPPSPRPIPPPPLPNCTWQLVYVYDWGAWTYCCF